MDDGHKPDALEKGFRFGCGFTFGAMLALWLVLDWVAGVTGVEWAIGAGIAVVSGLLAVRYGDRFWSAVSFWFGSTHRNRKRW